MTTYKEAGVDIEAGDQAVKRISKLVKNTFNQNTLIDIASSKTVSVSHNTLRLTKENKKLLSPISEVINNNFSLSEPSSENLSLSILSSDNYYKSLHCSDEIKEKLLKAKNDVLGKVDKSMHETIETLEPDLRYGFVDEILDK